MKEVAFLCAVPTAPGVLIGCCGGTDDRAVVLDVRTVDVPGVAAVVHRVQSAGERLPTGLAVVGFAGATRDVCDAVLRGLAAEGVQVRVWLVVGETHCCTLDGESVPIVVASATDPATPVHPGWLIAYSEPVAMRVRVRILIPMGMLASVHTAIDAVADAARPIIEARVRNLAWTLRDTATGTVWGGDGALNSGVRGPLLLHWFAEPEPEVEREKPASQKEIVCDVSGHAAAVVCVPRGLGCAEVAAAAKDDLLRCVGDAFTAAHFQFGPDVVLEDCDVIKRLWRLALPCRCVAENPRLALPVLEYSSNSKEDEGAEDRFVLERLSTAFDAEIHSFVRLDGDAESAALQDLFSGMLSHIPCPGGKDTAAGGGGGGWGWMCAVQ